jgi:RimJ/RimL family protein N-acetyltransferase
MDYALQLGFPLGMFHDCYLWHRDCPTMINIVGGTEEQFTLHLVTLLARSFHWSIISEQDEVVGLIAVEPIHQSYTKLPRDGEVHVALSPKVQARGVIERALIGAGKILFAEYPTLLRLSATILGHNRPSIKCAKRLGIQLEGTSRQAVQFGDALLDLHHYGITREEFMRNLESAGVN